MRDSLPIQVVAVQAASIRFVVLLTLRQQSMSSTRSVCIVPEYCNGYGVKYCNLLTAPPVAESLPTWGYRTRLTTARDIRFTDPDTH